MDCIVGVDVHMVAPDPGTPIHPYFGPIYLWYSPKFPASSTLINGMPACTVGAMSYFAHMPQGKPQMPSMLNAAYWKRYLINIPMVMTLMSLTVLANITVGSIAMMLPKPKSAENFLKEVTGIDSTSNAVTWRSIKMNLAIFTKWKTWVKLLMPPLPYPGAQGSIAVGSPNVTLNGGPLAVAAPLVAASCTDIPIVPNASILGFSNVMVGVDLKALVMGAGIGVGQGVVTGGASQGSILGSAIAMASMRSLKESLETQEVVQNRNQGQKSCQGGVQTGARFKPLVRSQLRG